MSSKVPLPLHVLTGFLGSGKTTVLATGRTFSVAAEARLADGAPAIMASPAVAGDTLFVGTRTHLYAGGKK